MSTFKPTRILQFAIFVILAGATLVACSGNSVNKPTANSTDGTSSNQPVSTPANPSDISFSKDVSPLLQAACVKCHGGEKTSKGLDLKTFDSLMLGSQNGSVIVAGNPTNSKLIQSVQSGKMPKNGPMLTPDQIQILVDWVNAGAKNN